MQPILTLPHLLFLVATLSFLFFPFYPICTFTSNERTGGPDNFERKKMLNALACTEETKKTVFVVQPGMKVEKRGDEEEEKSDAILKCSRRVH